jgi:hypothetical protein
MSVALDPGFVSAGEAIGETIKASWNSKASPCKPGVYRQPKGPFAVVLFCEESLGSHLSLLYLDPLGGRANRPSGLWTINDRYWHQPDWGADVTGFAWSTDGRLFVSSNNVYGQGSLYEVNPMQRTAKRLLPEKLGQGQVGPGYILYGVDSQKSLLRISPGGDYHVK